MKSLFHIWTLSDAFYILREDNSAVQFRMAVRVELDLVSFGICWLSILAVHAAATAYYTVVAMFYWKLQTTHLTAFLQYFDIGMSVEHYQTIALVHAVCAFPHGACVLLMLGGSLLQQQLSFRFALPRGGSRLSTSRFATLTLHQRVAPIHATVRRVQDSIATTRTAGYLLSFFTAGVFTVDRVFGSGGFLGVNGKHFDTILVARELFETALQSAQAYNMSRLLPRVELNRMYTSLIIINCWVTALIRFIFAKRVAHERFLSLLIDCALDLVSSAGITLTIVSFYLKDYDWFIGGFWDELWVNDVWSTQALSELQLVFVTSWADLATRVVFAIGAIMSLADVKSLLHLSRRRNRVQSVSTSAVPNKRRTRAASALQWSDSIQGVLSNPTSRQQSTSGPCAADAMKSAKMTSHSRLSTIFSCTLAAWGFILLVLHVHAASLPTVEQCILQVRPWGEAVPHCSLVMLNCYELNIKGRKDQVDALWREFGRGTVERVLIRHCPHLEIPPLLNEFGALTALKMYNSTISEWNAAAAITGMSHPRIELVYLVRVTLPGGVIPGGLLSLDIPTTLLEMTICASNLRELPDDLDQSWPKGIAINLELSALSSVPDCLVRLQPSMLSLYGNPLHSLPSALFEIEGMTDLDVGESQLEALPEHVAALSSTLTYVFVPNTQISSFPPWIDPIVTRAATDMFFLLYASGTPYCAAWERVLNGSASTLEGLPASKSLLMDAVGHYEDIYVYLTCDAFFAQPYFPLQTEDAEAALVQRSLTT